MPKYFWLLVFGIVCGVLILPMRLLAFSQSYAKVTLTPNTNNSVNIIQSDDLRQPFQSKLNELKRVDGTESTLSINYISNLKFSGKTSTDRVTELKLDNKTAMVQISDFRDTGTGWSLQLTPRSLTGRHKQLTTSLSLGSVQVITMNGSVSDTPKLVSHGEIRTNQVSNILVANKNAGIGTWGLILSHDVNPTHVKVYDSQIESGNYRGELVWSLTDAPS
ncbi:WxL domain-containing protein [Lactiplantibacillus plantarum]|nr:WxL domain-containing protein [Lactiplantibacillus plantarum]